MKKRLCLLERDGFVLWKRSNEEENIGGRVDVLFYGRICFDRNEEEEEIIKVR